MEFIGIDVGASELVVARHHQLGAVKRYPNTAAGHGALMGELTRRGVVVRVCLEASGVYSLDLALALHAHPGIAVMVANPRAIRHFAEALQTRQKSDPVDAAVLAEFAARMDFAAWQPPAATTLALRQITRQATAFGDELVAARNRLHAAEATATTPGSLRRVMRHHIAALERLIVRLERDAMALVHDDAGLLANLHLLTSIAGVGDRTALRLLGELGSCVMTMDKRQIVAYAGLDVRKVKSGTSVDKPARLSKRGNAHLRRTLYMPALTAIRCDRHFRAFYDRLCAAGKKPLQAIAAVMRKLLHAISAVLRLQTPFDGAKLFAARP